MTLLLFLARELVVAPPTPATELVAIPANYLDFHIDQTPPMGAAPRWSLPSDSLVNDYIRFVTGFEISWALGNKATMKCQTVDPYEDDPTDSYRPLPGQNAQVLLRDGTVLFNGRIQSTRERALDEPNSYTVVELEIVDMSDALSHRFVSVTFGGDPNPVAIAYQENPARIQLRDPHGLATGDTVMIRDVVINGTTPHPTNGQHVVTVLDANTITVPVNASTVGSGAGGTVSKMVQLRDVLIALNPHFAEYNITLDPDMEPGPFIERVTLSEKSITEILRYLSATTGWPHRLLPSGVLQMFSPGSIVAPFTLDASAVTGGLTIEKQRVTKANRVLLKYGSSLTVEKAEQFVGDGARREWPLKYRPASGNTAVSPGHVLDHNTGVMKHVGVFGVDNLFEYVYRWSDNTLVQLAFSYVPHAPVPAGYAQEFVMPVQFPQSLIEPEDDADLGGEEPREIKIENPDIFDYYTAKQFAQGKLAQVDEEPRRASVPTDAGLVWPGAVFDVDLPHRAMGGQWLVDEVRMTERGDASLHYVYSLLEGTTQSPGWRDRVRELFGGASGSTSSISGGGVGPAPAFPPGQSGVQGSGTINRVPLWTGATTLGDSPMFVNGVGEVEVTADLRARASIYTDFDLHATRDVIADRAVVTPAVQAVADLMIAPTAGITLDPGNNLVLPDQPYSVNLGQLTRKFLTIHAAELWVETLVAQETMATIGGRIIVAPTTQLVADLSASAATIRTKHNNLRINDVVYMEANARVEFMLVTSGPIGSAGDWTYGVTRNLDGTGANDWYAGDAVVNTGTTGNGFIDIYSVRGVRAGTEIGPTIVGNVRTSSTFNSWAPRWAIGNLRGLYGYNTDVYGAAFGDNNAAWIKIDPFFGVNIGHGDSVFASITPSGSASFTGSITITGGNAAKLDLTNVDVNTLRFATQWNYPGTTFIHGGNIFTGTIVANHIAAGQILAGHIAAGQITADKLNVTTLSAITANLGSVTAGSISGVTITGTTISGNTISGGTISGTTITGSTLQAGGSGGDVTIDSGGITISAGTGTSQKIKWSNNAQVYASSGYIEVFGPSEVRLTSGGVVTADGMRPSASGQGLGDSSHRWGETWIQGDIHQTPSDTTADDVPMVYSVGNGIYYKKTNGLSGTFGLSGGGYITCHHGIVIDAG